MEKTAKGGRVRAQTEGRLLNSQDRPAPIFTGVIKEDGKLHLNFPDRYAAHIATLPRNMELEIVGPRLPRWDASKAQKGYFGAVILWHYKRLSEFEGWDDEQIKKFLYSNFAPRIEDPGEKPKAVRLSRMSWQQAQEFFERCRMYALETYRHVIPLPGETDFDD